MTLEWNPRQIKDLGLDVGLLRFDTNANRKLNRQFKTLQQLGLNPPFTSGAYKPFCRKIHYPFRRIRGFSYWHNFRFLRFKQLLTRKEDSQ